MPSASGFATIVNCLSIALMILIAFVFINEAIYKKKFKYLNKSHFKLATAFYIVSAIVWCAISIYLAYVDYDINWSNGSTSTQTVFEPVLFAIHYAGGLIITFVTSLIAMSVANKTAKQLQNESTNPQI